MGVQAINLGIIACNLIKIKTINYKILLFKAENKPTNHLQTNEIKMDSINIIETIKTKELLTFLPAILPQLVRFCLKWLSGEWSINIGRIKTLTSNLNDNKSVLSPEEQTFLKNILNEKIIRQHIHFIEKRNTNKYIYISNRMYTSKFKRHIIRCIDYINISRGENIFFLDADTIGFKALFYITRVASLAYFSLSIMFIYNEINESIQPGFNGYLIGFICFIVSMFYLSAFPGKYRVKRINMELKKINTTLYLSTISDDDRR